MKGKKNRKKKKTQNKSTQRKFWKLNAKHLYRDDVDKVI